MVGLTEPFDRSLQKLANIIGCRYFVDCFFTTSHHLRLLCDGAFQTLHEDGVMYAEVIVSIWEWIEKGLQLEELVKTLTEAGKRVEPLAFVALLYLLLAPLSLPISSLPILFSSLPCPLPLLLSSYSCLYFPLSIPSWVSYFPSTSLLPAWLCQSSQQSHSPLPLNLSPSQRTQILKGNNKEVSIRWCELLTLRSFADFVGIERAVSSRERERVTYDDTRGRGGLVVREIEREQRGRE